MPQASKVAGISITHPDRVVYGDSGITKLELAQFYDAIAKWLLPHVVDRPLSIVRCPGGLDAAALGQAGPKAGRGGRGDGACFYQKHANATMPPAIRRVPIREAGKVAPYLAIDDESGLLTLIQFGALEIHPWGAHAGRPDSPDRMIFDLDPGQGVDWKAVVRAAREVREQLAKLDLQSFVKTTGGKGLHVVVPLAPKHDWDEVRDFSRTLAEKMVAADPDHYVATMALHLRPGKIFLDYLRNGRGATAVAAYSSRAKPGAPIAIPVSWDELDSIGADAFHLRDVPAMLERRKVDPWREFFRLRQGLGSGTQKPAKPKRTGAAARPRSEPRSRAEPRPRARAHRARAPR